MEESTLPEPLQLLGSHGRQTSETSSQGGATAKGVPAPVSYYFSSTASQLERRREKRERQRRKNRKEEKEKKEERK